MALCHSLMFPTAVFCDTYLHLPPQYFRCYRPGILRRLFLFMSESPERSERSILKDYNNILSIGSDNTSKTIIGDTTYIVSSFFKEEAKGDVIDKVRRLIEREVENAAFDRDFSGNTNRFEV